MNWTQAQLDEYLTRHPPKGGGSRRFGRQKRPISTVEATLAAVAAPSTAKSSMFALGRLPAGTMNKLEAAYDAHLWQQRHAGEVLWHKFEAVKLRLADNTFYTCDFAVLPKSGVLEMHECKGFWQDDAKVKIKVAASIYPFIFVAIKAIAKKHGGGWKREEF